QVDFGHVLIPQDLTLPKKRILPEFKRLAHGVRSGNVTILDAKTFYIPNLHYDGAGPDAFFWVGKGYEPSPLGLKVPNEIGSYDVLRGYEGEDIEIQLPDNLTVYDIGYLSIWCIEYRHNFGHVIIPPAAELWVPPALGQTRIKPHLMGSSDFDNCRQLNENLQVQWQATDKDVQIKLTGRVRVDEYIAFGLSGNQERPQMLNSDIVVVYYDSADGSYHAVDYSITGKSQCDGKLGVCPDDLTGGQNDASVISGERHDGVTSVTFSRPYETSDPSDIPISKIGEPVTVIAAIGTINTKKQANYHHTFVTKDLVTLDFTSVGDNSCAQLAPEEQPEEFKPWPINIIQDTHNFSVMIGPTGGKRGYSAITGSPSWGISWWVNGLLIPEIHVVRGQTYYFTIEGGDDLNNSANYHPFYITDSSEGGFSQKIESEQKQERVFAGVTYSKLGIPKATALGRLCKWQPKTVDSWEKSLTFKEYRDTLHRACDPGNTGSLTWTVMEDTPDLVYYQCYTHQYLGWKIHVHDPGFNLPQNGAGPLRSNLLPVFLFVLLALR
ncbi:UNVERIFIED_CONTAM: hypothetical protein GTU68_048316, partial [Idotea baltica]|nr:hypothetical protein [Idotea baltica]